MQTSSDVNVVYRPLSLDEILANPDCLLRDFTVLHEGTIYLKVILPSPEPPTQEIPLPASISTQDLISTRTDEHGLHSRFIRREAVSNYTILSTSGRPAEICTPHVNRNRSEIPERLYLATKKTIVDVLRIHILQGVGTTSDRPVILACPLCGFCPLDFGRAGAARLRGHLETHDEFRCFLYECSKQHGGCGKRCKNKTSVVKHQEQASLAGCNNSVAVAVDVRSALTSGALWLV